MDWVSVRKSLRGPAALISSVFHENLELKPEGIERNIRGMVDRGFGSIGAGFFIAPCADGEYVTLNPTEVGQVVSAVGRGSNHKLPIVAGIHSLDWRQVIAMGQAARDAGAVAVMLAPPIYYALNSEAIIDWYERFAAKVDIGIMIYEQSFRGPATNAVIKPPLVGRLLDIPNVVAMKHIGLFSLVDEYTIIDTYKDRIAYVDTSAACASTTAHMHGATSFITEIAPFWPEIDNRYWQLLEAGSYREAELWRMKVAPLIRFIEDHPASTGPYSWVTVLKVALEYVGLEGGPVRPPFRALNAGERQAVVDVLKLIDAPRA